MEHTLRTHLLALAEAHCAAKGLSEATVARLSAGDWRFFSRIREGKTFTMRTYDTVVGWFSANWVEGAPWVNPIL